MGAVEVDRWVLPPAVAAAVFALAAVSPPVSTADLQRGLRVEAVTAADGVILVRGSIERVDDGALAAPRALAVTHDGATVIGRATAGVAGVSVAVPTAVRRGRARLTIEADGLRANVTVPVGPAALAPPAVAEGSLAARVAEGNLLPEVAGTVLVRAEGAAELRVEPQLEGVTVSPARAAPGPCGVASFRVTVVGMGAPVTLVARRADGSEQRAHVRLPLAPGGVSLARDGAALTVRGAFAGQAVHLLGGTAAGARWWASARLVADEVCPRADVPLPAGLAWVRASTDALFRDEAAPTLRWDATPPACARDEGARRWHEASAAAPPRPDVGVAFDGAARARAALSSRVRRARGLAWLGLAGAIAAEVALMLGLGLRQGMSDVEGARALRRSDLGRFATGVIALMLLGFALALASARGVSSP